MKLISMTDFVLQQIKIQQSTSEFKEVIKNYANFLNQKLSFEMFIKAGEEDTVLFKGFNLTKGDPDATDCYTSYLDNKDLDIFVGYKKDWEDDWVILESMECFQNYSNVELTDLAIKTIGL